MIISHIKMKNWRNFRNVDTPLGRRMFLVGANASGKSNFLDALRFLRDIAKTEGGGLQSESMGRSSVYKFTNLWDVPQFISLYRQGLAGRTLVYKLTW